VDNGATITVTTGVATFTIKKSSFNVLDTVDIGGTRVVEPSSSALRGLVLTGPSPTAPYPGNVTCLPDAGGSACTTVYSSANDATSSCTIEENGPVMAVVRCIGTHKDSSGNPYMQFTVRETFYRGRTSVKVTSVLRNANYVNSTDSGGNTFNTAYKGLASYELRLSPNITGPLSYTFANHTATPTTGTLSGTDSAYIYQAKNNWQKQQIDCGAACFNAYTTDTGYAINVAGSNLQTGTEAQPSGGWADVRNSSGAGIQIGVGEIAAWWPKSLEVNGASDTRIGIWPRQNSQAIYQAWPAWSIHDLFLNFHTSILSAADLRVAFLKWQHYLVGRADPAYYNSTGVFPYNLPNATEEAAFYRETWDNAHCINCLTTNPLTTTSATQSDLGTANTTIWPLVAPRYKAWFDGGPSNQEEFRWGNMLKFLRTGQTGRWLEAANFYRFWAEKAIPHADGTSSDDATVNGFRWRNQSNLNIWGRSRVACAGTPMGKGPGENCSTMANATKSFTSWMDELHPHWHGILDYYRMTGDETIKEAILANKDWYLNTNSLQGGATLSGQTGFNILRGTGTQILSASRFGEFLGETGDPDAAGVLANAVTHFNQDIKPDPCVNNYPTGCTMPPLAAYQTGGDPPGVSRVRGIPATRGARFGASCQLPAGNYRGVQPFQMSMVIEGLMALQRAKGSSWADYNLAGDLAYGVSQFMLLETFSDDGGAYYYSNSGTTSSNNLYNGFRYNYRFDLTIQCPDGTSAVAGTTSQFGDGRVYHIFQTPDTTFPQQNVFAPFQAILKTNGALSADELRKLKIAMAWPARYSGGIAGPDMWNYHIADVIQQVREPSRTLQDIPFTVQDLGGGNYRLTFTPPAGTTSLRIKWSPKTIAPSTALLGYNLFTQAFALNPNNYMTWFGANTTTEPVPTPGSAQTFSVNTGTSGLTGANFSVKGYITGSGGTLPPPPPPPPPAPPPPPSTGTAASLVYVSGNNQETSITTHSSGDSHVSWTRQTVNTTYPGAVGYLQIFFDPVSQRTIYYGNVRTSSSIYSTNVFFYDASTNNFTHLGGTGTMSSVCTLDAPTQPGERHPYWQMAIDTKRNLMWMASGVNQACNGNPRGPDSSPREDLYYLKLNPNPALATWRQVTPATPVGRLNAAMAYDSENDVLLLFGQSVDNSHHIYCPTLDPVSLEPTGVLTARQVTAGCSSPDNWTKLTLANGTVTVNGTSVTLESGNPFTNFVAGDSINIAGTFYRVASIADPTHLTLVTSAGTGSKKSFFVMPLAIAQPGLLYDLATRRIILFGGSNQAQTVIYNQIWAYDAAARTWTHKALSTIAPPLAFSSSKTQPQPEMAYDPVHRKIYYHQVAGTGSPADWQYDPVADTWVQLSSIGSGPTRGSAMSYDPSCNCLVTYSNLGGSGTPPDMWVGAISESSSGSSSISPLSNGLVVKVVDASGNPVSGVPVTFTVTSGGGKLTGGVTVLVVNSDALGLASASYTVGAIPGVNLITASSGTLLGSPVTFTASGITEALNPCDVNLDGAVNSLDVNAATNQVLGLVACTNADLNGAGCSVVDLQRIVTAALGGECRTGL
jgi:hypothetical protein